MLNSTGLGTLGRVALYKSERNPYELAVADSHVTVIRPFKTFVMSDYLYYYFANPSVQSVIEDQADGTTKQKELATTIIKSYLISIPPLVEQHRIVSKIKILLPLIEEYDKKEKQLTNLNTTFPDSLKKSILQQAVQGKLVPQDPSDEPASVLLERIRKEKQRLIKGGKIKKDKQESIIYRRDNSHYERCDGVERCIDEEIPFEIPESWEWVRFGNLFAINPRNSLPDDILVGFMPMSFLQEGFENRHTFVTKLWKEVKSGFTHLADNDIVIAKITPCFQNRKSAIIRNFPNGYGAGTTELHVLRDFTNILYMPYFLLICKSQMFIQEGIKNFTGTASLNFKLCK